MEKQGVKLNDDTHQKLVDYVVKNPAFKMRDVASVAIKTWLELDKEAKIVSILKHGEVNDDEQKQA